MEDLEVHVDVRFNVWVVFVHDLIRYEVAMDTYILVVCHWHYKIGIFMSRPS